MAITFFLNCGETLYIFRLEFFDVDVWCDILFEVIPLKRFSFGVRPSAK